MEKKTYTIGVLLDWLENSYHTTLIHGIEAGAKAYNLNIFSFVGGAINSPRPYEKNRNLIYNYVNEKNVDGIIIFSGSVGLFCSIDELDKYCERFHPLPVMSISQRLKSTYSILVDNSTGLKAMLIHLIKDHGYKNIAMIKGPEDNQEASERFQVYKATLEEYGIPYNPDMVYPGRFISESGYEAVNYFLEKKDLEIDAIFAANDDMAIGAIKALQEKNIMIPLDIAVVGFDDQITSSYTNPVVTTVRQPLFEQGYVAIENLYKILTGEKIEIDTILPTEVVIRESCGCMLKEIDEAAEKVNNDTLYITENEGRPVDISRELIGSLHTLLQNKNISIPGEDIYKLITVCISSIKSGDSRSFYKLLNSLLYKRELTEGMYDVWHEFFFNLKNAIYKFLKEYEDKEKADKIFHVTNQIITNFIIKNLKYKKLKEERIFFTFRDVSERLGACSTMEEIVDLLKEQFALVNIRACYFALYGNSNDNITPCDTHLILAYADNEVLDYSKEQEYFPSDLLIPSKFLKNRERWSLIVEPISFGAIRLGYVLLDINLDIEYAFRVTRRLFLFTALKNAVYVQKIVSQANTLEKANDELYSTLERLKETQAKLIQSEKLSALGGLVAGISHEINTPLGISVTAASHLEEIAAKLQQLCQEERIKKSDFTKYLQSTIEASQMIISNLKRAHNLIRSFKQVAVDQSTSERRKFNVKGYIEEIQLSLLPNLKKTEHKIYVNCPHGLEIYSYPGAFSQILTNLIMNAVIHAYDKGDKGNICIEVYTEKKNIILKFRDDGKGIDPANHAKIFEPFYTTKRGQGGTGLGLHVVYNIVNQTLNGSIKLNSSLGKGTEFIISFPISIS